mgnify:CR=1 FL=1
MVYVMLVWMMAMIAGLCWARWAAILATGAVPLEIVEKTVDDWIEGEQKP